jgi:hypothetical protein
MVFGMNNNSLGNFKLMPAELSNFFLTSLDWTIRQCIFNGLFNQMNFNNGYFNNGNSIFPSQTFNTGDWCNFSNGGVNNSTSSTTNSSSTAEERVAANKARDKFTKLKELLNNYAQKITDDDKKALLQEKLRDCSSYSEDNYSKLKELYENNKTDIQKFIRTSVDVEIKSSDINAVNSLKKAFNNQSANYENILKTDSTGSLTEELKDGVNSLAVLSGLFTATSKSFKTSFAKVTDPQQRAKLTKVKTALYNGLKTDSAKLQNDKNISDDTKEKLSSFAAIAGKDATTADLDSFYYWVKIAKAEIADKKYSVLQNDFPEDEILGKSFVTRTTEELKAIGITGASASTSTSTTEFDTTLTGKEAMTSLESRDVVTKLSSAQLQELNNISGVKVAAGGDIKEAWVDNSCNRNFKRIRIVDNQGNIKVLTKVGLKDGTIQKTNNDTVGLLDSMSPEKLDARDKLIKKICSENSKLKQIPVTNKQGFLVFEEKTASNSGKKRLFIVGDDGKLKLWKYTTYNNNNSGWFYRLKSTNEFEYEDIDYDSI